MTAEADKLRRGLGQDERAVTVTDDQERAYITAYASALRREAEVHRAAAAELRRRAEAEGVRPPGRD